MLTAQARRERMVQEQIVARGVRSPLVLSAMARVRRELFVPEEFAESAYEDSPLPIGCGQTISQPYVVALMIEALLLKGGEKVLEIGAGSGYAAAVLAEIAGEVFAIERLGKLAKLASTNLRRAHYRNAYVRRKDGTLGWAAEAPFDAILVSAGAPSIPDSLKKQLAIGGCLLVPVGPYPREQELIRLTRTGPREFEGENLGEVHFVPLIGREGWEPDHLPLSPPRPSAIGGKE